MKSCRKTLASFAIAASSFALCNLAALTAAALPAKHPTTQSTVSLNRLISQAGKGDAAAEFQLGLAYEEGNGTEPDYGRAAEWYEKAANAGNSAAQNNLGVLYATGRGVQWDDARALSWYLRAAVSGNAAAQNNVGYMYSNGRGTRADLAEAARWYRKAAAQHYPSAEANLACLYSLGRVCLAMTHKPVIYT